MSTSQRRGFIPCLEMLEDRLTPAGAVTGSFLNGTWTLTGDVLNNSIHINSTGTPGSFEVTSGIVNPTVVDGVTTHANIRSIVIDFQAGNDSVFFNNNAALPIKLTGKLTINGGDGDNIVIANVLTVNKKVAISNGTGVDNIMLSDFKARAGVVINTGDGGSNIEISTSGGSFGFNSIAGNLSITSGGGADGIDVKDTNVLGNITINCGLGSGVEGSFFNFWNVNQITTRALIGGNINVTFLNEQVDNTILDTKVQGNVTFNNGSGSSETRFDGVFVNQQVLIVGNLTINGTGANVIGVGNALLQTGLKVKGNFTVNLAAAADLVLFHLTVLGRTIIV